MKHARACVGLLFLVSSLSFGSAGAQAAVPSPDLAPAAFTQAEEGSWPMLAANPERTSWTSTQVPSEEYMQSHRNTWGNGMLYPEWARVIRPFVNGKIQVIAANGLLYISSARGLYALDADDGDIAWVYPTELPLGHSPTIDNGTLYVGGLDGKIHAMDAVPDPATLPVDSQTGYRINNRLFWTFEALGANNQLGAGFETNPLVVNHRVYAGNRNGMLYAIFSNDHPDLNLRGKLAWRYQTGGPIRFSAAYKDGVIYFGSLDAHAYALDAATGALVWKSAKLPGAGFHSYWPVVYGDWVVFAGSHHYMFSYLIGSGAYMGLENADVFQGQVAEGDLIGPQGTEPYSWVAGTMTLDAHRATEHSEQYPERRRYFVLNRATGEEFTFDSDGDGNREYAPIIWCGTHSGNKYPPAVGKDGVLYQGNHYLYGPFIGRGQVSGWKFGTQYISLPTSFIGPIDEPYGYSIGGNIVYFAEWFNNQGGAFDLSVPSLKTPPDADYTREWHFYDYNLYDIIPGLSGMRERRPNAVYGYQTLNPPIPYRDRVYTNNGGVIVAWGMSNQTPVVKPTAEPVPVTQNHSVHSMAELQQKLEAEIQKMLQAGHLRPGYHSQGMSDLGLEDISSKYLSHYFARPGETIKTLLWALPHLSPELREQTRAYIQQEFTQYPPYQISHIGWKDGAPREVYDPPPDVQAKFAAFGPETGDWWFEINANMLPPDSFYALWKYAAEFGGAADIFARSKGNLRAAPSDTYLATYPHIHNAYIAGYWGYLELQKLAGEPESANVRNELNRLLALRASNFSKDHVAWTGETRVYMGPIASSINFMYLVPELGDYLREHALAKVEPAVADYQETIPYWFVSKYDSTFGEGTLQMLYDAPAIFQAKAWILHQSREELSKYLDVPAFERGDLFYIQNLVALIEAEAQGPMPTFADVPFSHPYYDEIEALYRAGYTAGCNTNPLMYCPEQTMNRAESSVFVERGIHTASYDPPAPSSQVFGDMPLDSWAAKWVNGLWQDQYTAGCGTNPLVYCPWQGHTRAEGCVFYLRMLNAVDFDPPQPTQQTFADVPLDAWYAKWVEAAYEVGLLTACQTTPELRFCPNDPLTRALAATMMVQAKGLLEP